ncbi:DUF1552 domain-containing protein [Crateriforma conspicua]|uniref:DUF1552 domain-containing protein n=1 Tax=Crateriforma conspicua TaxID=2527996 RepID=UPI0011887AF5|nr:DUF1552 domain-containing protein [Crateriforma conspicua]QDV64798.1 hypothetical protein Mal65_39620 [Crateriforma conspicua]
MTTLGHCDSNRPVPSRRQTAAARRISRRTLLRGAAGVTVGLPLLEEMMLSTAVAGHSTSVPVRAFNVFFGLGIPAPLQREGYGGVLEPLESLKDKLLVMRNVDQVRCDQSGINAHFDGASGAFTAEPPSGEAKAGGPSIDQVIRRTQYADGLPTGMVPTLIGGTFFRRSRVSRYVHSYNIDGTVAASMQERPRDLFDRVFGHVDSGSNADESTVREKRLRKSVLDSVVDQYKHYTGPSSPLGTASRGRVADHLDRIRELEQRAFSLQRSQHTPVDPPPESSILHGGLADPGGEGIDITLDELTSEWRLMAELYALAVHADRVRFGSLTFLAAGERIRLTGDYHYGDRLVHTFDDASRLNASGSKGCSHEWWHKFNPKKDNTELRAHAHMKMREVAFFLKQLDAVTEANGKTILENSLVTISTESGDGRHNDPKRELSGVFHAISGGGGRFKTGQIMDVGQEGLDVYNTMLSAFDAASTLGPKRRDHQTVDAILA